jgi:hypothetical protein
LESLQNRFAIAAQSLRDCFVITPESHRKYSESAVNRITSQLLRNHCKVAAAEPLRNRFAIPAKSLLQNHFAIALQSLRIRRAIAAKSLHNRFKTLRIRCTNAA